MAIQLERARKTGGGDGGDDIAFSSRRGDDGGDTIAFTGRTKISPTTKFGGEGGDTIMKTGGSETTVRPLAKTKVVWTSAPKKNPLR